MERQFTELNFQIVIEPKIIESTFNLLNSSLAHVSTLKTFLIVFLEKNVGGTLNLKLFQVCIKRHNDGNHYTIIPSPKRAPIKI